jgi:hypothetical protein
MESSDVFDAFEGLELDLNDHENLVETTKELFEEEFGDPMGEALYDLAQIEP